jgi:WD40 repeat protein
MKFPGDQAWASFSPDGRKVVTGSYKGIVQIWDATTAERILPPIELGEQAVEPPQFSPDGRKLFTVKWGGVLQVWDAKTAKLVTGPLRHVQEVSAAWSPDSRWVVGWSGETAQVWDASKGERVGPQLRHQAAVSSAAFSPDSRRLVTASGDHTAQIWDPLSGLKLSPPLQHSANLTRAIFSPDGRRILTTCVDGTALVWEFPQCHWPVADLRLLARALSGRSIDAAGNAVVLAPMALQAALAKLRSRQPDYFRQGAKVTNTR